MSTARLATTVLLMATAVQLLIACGPDDPPDTPPGAASEANTNSGSPTPNQPNLDPRSGASREDEMRIEITLNGERFQAMLEDSAASRDLVAQLPLTLDMDDHGAVEKTGRLPSGLSLDGQPAGADPDVGDVGYYAPGNDLVLYYGDQSYYEGIVVLGHLDGDAAERIARMEGTVTVSVRPLNE